MILDSKQIFIQKKLQELVAVLEKWYQTPAVSDTIFSWFRLFRCLTPQVSDTAHSIYLYGGVGRGKSMLMKEFLSQLKKTPHAYFHFNSFMRLIHENLHKIRKEKNKYFDELIEALKRVIKNNRVIGFDEFQVLDIADAMLLSRIFTYLFNNGIVVIFTSNSHPQDLYKNGLQREVFLEFVNHVLLKNCEVLLLENNVDYRELYKKNLHKRYFIKNEKNQEIVAEIIDNLTDGGEFEPKIIKVWGRDLEIKKAYNKIAVINFDEIIRTELSASDYQAICQNFDLIFLLGVFQLQEDEINEVRRFILFIDEVYENKVAMIVLSDVEIEKIYDPAKMESFKRTISRLKEIKSDSYWKLSKVI